MRVKDSNPWGVDLGVVDEFKDRWDRESDRMERGFRELINPYREYERNAAEYKKWADEVMSSLSEEYKDDSNALSDIVLKAKGLLQSRTGTIVTGLFSLTLAGRAISVGYAGFTAVRAISFASQLSLGMAKVGVGITATNQQLTQWHSSGAGLWLTPSGLATGMTATFLGHEPNAVVDIQNTARRMELGAATIEVGRSAKRKLLGIGL